ncbi:variable surface protein [Plasmodium gonderi]|uniref:Variable surface protein n=1 Tax=Plasmodium gonderi TaxID=77519 RepID=A0A1Y1JPU4_PLAGO|nr:variable surface protein [Plasmodium gonderi]GAW84646.1 variable surface protein [Plasmodium gonderi]
MELGRCLNFINRLKVELYQKHIKCGGISSCYDKMMESLQKQFFLNRNHKCKKHLVDLDEEAYPIFYKLDLISNYTYKLMLGDGCWEETKYDNYINDLIKSSYVYDENFYNVLKEVVNTYKNACNRSRVILPHFSEIKNEVVVTSVHSEASTQSRIFKSESLEGSSGIVSDTVEFGKLLTEEVYVIRNILEIYTRYSLVLLSWVRNVRGIFNKNHYEHQNLMDSFERERNNSFHDRIKIAYSSEDNH